MGLEELLSTLPVAQDALAASESQSFRSPLLQQILGRQAQLSPQGPQEPAQAAPPPATPAGPPSLLDDLKARMEASLQALGQAPSTQITDVAGSAFPFAAAPTPMGALASGGLGGMPVTPGMPGVPGTPPGPGTLYTGPTTFQPVDTGRVPIVDRRPPPIPSATEVAPEIQRVYYEVWSRWPSSTNMGTHVVKNIAGTNTLSEHSFGDAIDIGGPVDQLATQASWLANHAHDLNITQVIFQDRIWTPEAGWHPYTAGGHDTHIHVSGPMTYSDTSPDFPTITWTPPARHGGGSGTSETPRRPRVQPPPPASRALV